MRLDVGEDNLVMYLQAKQLCVLISLALSQISRRGAVDFGKAAAPHTHALRLLELILFTSPPCSRASVHTPPPPSPLASVV